MISPSQIPPEKLIFSHKYWHFLEMIPGLITWLTFIILVWGSIVIPKIIATFIIIYTMIWLFRSIKMTLMLIYSLNVSKKIQQNDWNKLLEYIEHPKNPVTKDSSEKPIPHFSEFDLQQRLDLLKNTNQYLKPSEIYHAVLLVTYKESYEVLFESIKSYASTTFDSKKIFLIFACEEADLENATNLANQLKEEFKNTFKDFIVTVHPKNLPGEIKGKSGNATWAAKEFRKYLDHHKIDYERIILSNFDADSIVHPNYFSELTFRYLTALERTKKGYQPIHFFHNNVWDVPFFTRLIALSCSYWRLAESLEKEKFKSFSSRSIGFKTVVETGYWDPSIIPEDSREYWNNLIIYQGNYEVIPVYTPVYMDAVLSETYLKTFLSQYKQLRRWAYGIGDFPFVAFNLWYNTPLPKIKKISLIIEFLRDGFFWATGPILLSLSGFLPGILNDQFKNTVFAYNLPYVMSNLLTIASVGILICALLTLKIVPHHPNKSYLSRLLISIQWLFTPMLSIILSSIPAIEAQTRLLINKKLEYQVTHKARKSTTS